MPGGADLFVVCKKCGSEVSPYITECPYCGTRLRRRAPRIDRDGEEARPRDVGQPKLSPLLPGEIPGIRGDPLARPYMTLLLVAASLMGFVVFQAIAPADVVMSSLTEEPWRYATAAFMYETSWYALAVVVGLGIYGWRLELRHGPLVVLAVFLLCGIGANALALQSGSASLLIGAPGAAMGMLGAWVVPDLLRARRGADHDGDLLGTLVIALVLALMPLATPECDPVATFAGLGAGLVIGLALSRTRAAR